MPCAASLSSPDGSLTIDGISVLVFEVDNISTRTIYLPGPNLRVGLGFIRQAMFPPTRPLIATITYGDGPAVPLESTTVTSHRYTRTGLFRFEIHLDSRLNTTGVHDCSTTQLDVLSLQAHYIALIRVTNLTGGTGNNLSLVVSPSTTLSSSGSLGGPFTPTDKIYTLTNLGTSSLNWSATKTQSWITLSSTSGTLAANQSKTVTVTINSGANSLLAGSYGDTVVFRNITANVSISRSVNLVITSLTAGNMTISPSALFETSGNVGGPFSPLNNVYTITNNGGLPIAWNVTKTQSWITLSILEGTLLSNQSVSVTASINVDANLLDFGSYGETLTFSNLTNGSGDTTRGIKLSVIRVLAAGEWDDSISFMSGPLEHQCFPLALDPTSESPIGTDANGNYLLFYVPDDIALTHPYTSADDVYNIQWFLANKSDIGLIGDAKDDFSDAKQFILPGSSEVNQRLKSIEHLYNGVRVSIANPSITCAKNYQNAKENSQHVFLVYQALEDGKWNIYLRQLRLSEYDKSPQVLSASQSTLVSIASLSISNVIYRVICVKDECAELSSEFYVKRSVVFEVILSDGRDVLNSNVGASTSNWGSLCDGFSESEFPRRKVFVKFFHTAIVNICPDQFTTDNIFYNWQAGEEYSVSATELSENDLFESIRRQNDSSIAVGFFDSPVTIDNVQIKSSTIGAIWYNSFDQGWSVMSDDPLDVLQQFKGFDINEPILLTADKTSHCTQPVIGVNYNNDVFVAYETVVEGLPQIEIIGTSYPSSSLPRGSLSAKDLDSSLDYFIKASDFIYVKQITDDGINQSSDIFVDLNDVIHLTWQSNRDTDWEIYYSNSADSFNNTRITKSKSKSLKPRITGNSEGTLYIAWHDDRFDNYEIMVAYKLSKRALPYSQQDPYWAGNRNHFIHYENTATAILSNDTQETICLSKLVAYFYFDRLKTLAAFSIAQNKFPLSFKVEGDQNITRLTSQSFNNFGTWTITNGAGTRQLVGTEYNSALGGSEVFRFKLNATINGATTIQISIRSSDTATDSNDDIQWTEWLNIIGQLGEWIYFAATGLSSSVGRYKQVRLRTDYVATLPDFSDLTIESVSPFRLCLDPAEEVSVDLVLTPEVRVDQIGSETESTPIAELFAQNNTYFLSIQGVGENNKTVSLGNQNITISCLSCKRLSISNDSNTCSLLIDDSSILEPAYVNYDVIFYTDKEDQIDKFTFDLSYGSTDLNYCVVNDDVDASDVWTNNGLLVVEGENYTILLYPKLSDGGIICGITYRVQVTATYTLISTGETTEKIIKNNSQWVCDCNSSRWTTEDPIVNLSGYGRWSSSAFSKSDTRLTESGKNNFNPVVRCRGDNQVVVIYESDREGDSQLYGSVFEFLPHENMYASGAEIIISPPDQIVVRSDIPLDLDGKNVAFDVDYYDNLFLAVEQPFIQEESPFNHKGSIGVRRCGLSDLDFKFNYDTIKDDTTQLDKKCVPRLTCYPANEDSLLDAIIKEVRINPESVRYYTYRGNQVVPVVKTCNIVITVVGMPEVISIRLRNRTTDEWSEWMPFDKKIGDYTVDIKWSLSPASGLKTIYFQLATYDGLATTFMQDIVADYNKVDFTLNFYKPVIDKVSPPGTVTDEVLQDSDIFNTDNRLNLYQNLYPVASIRPVSAGPDSDIPQGNIIINIISGNDNNGVDDKIKTLLLNSPPIPSDFNNNGQFAVIASFAAGWIPSIPASAAKWVADSAGGSALYSMPFNIASLPSGQINLVIKYAVDDTIQGIYLNGHLLENSTGGTWTSLSTLTVDVTALLTIGLNTIYFYVVNSGGGATGIIFDVSVVSESVVNITPQSIFPGQDYIFLEIIPDASYIAEIKQIEPDLQKMSPTFDFIQQGTGDLFAQSTRYFSVDGIDLFRGYITIQRDSAIYKSDGLAYIVPHFVNDCNNVLSLSNAVAETLITDVDYNVIPGATNATQKIIDIDTVDTNDTWATERDEFGFIGHRVVLREDDPYFVFGDPNFNLNDENES